MAGQTPAAAAMPEKFQEYYTSLMGQLRGAAPTIGYDEMSEGKIKANLIQSMRPSLEQSIAQRQTATGKNRALIDADAAARGIGASTWVTDAKNRLSDSEQRDISMLHSNYGASLAQQLGSRLAAERANKLAADQFNAGQDATAQQQALGMAWNLYQQWLASQAASGGGGGGRGGNNNDDANNGDGVLGWPNMNDVNAAYRAAAAADVKSGYSTLASANSQAAQKLVATQKALAAQAAAAGDKKQAATYTHWRPSR